MSITQYPKFIEYAIWRAESENKSLKTERNMCKEVERVRMRQIDWGYATSFLLRHFIST